MIKMQVKKNRSTRNFSFVVLISDMFLLKIWHPLRKSPEGLNLKMKNIIICVYLRNRYGMVIGNWKKIYSYGNGQGDLIMNPSSPK